MDHCLYYIYTRNKFWFRDVYVFLSKLNLYVFIVFNVLLHIFQMICKSHLKKKLNKEVWQSSVVWKFESGGFRSAFFFFFNSNQWSQSRHFLDVSRVKHVFWKSSKKGLPLMLWKDHSWEILEDKGFNSLLLRRERERKWSCHTLKSFSCFLLLPTRGCKNLERKLETGFPPCFGKCRFWAMLHF